MERVGKMTLKPSLWLVGFPLDRISFREIRKKCKTAVGCPNGLGQSTPQSAMD